MCSYGTCPVCSTACWGHWGAEGFSVWHSWQPYPVGILVHMKKTIITQKFMEMWFFTEIWKTSSWSQLAEILLAKTTPQWKPESVNKSGVLSFVNNLLRWGINLALQRSTECAVKISDNRSTVTFGVERDEAVTQRPFVHGLVEDDILWEDDHSDVLEPAQPLQNLGHWLWLGFLHHAADPHHNLSLWGLNKKDSAQMTAA